MAQSASHLAVALPLDPSPVTTRPPSRPQGPGIQHNDGHGSLVAAAVLVEPSSTPVARLGDFWRDVLEGRVVLCARGATPTRRFVVARRALEPFGQACVLSEREESMLARVLCGNQQKVAASELGIACSTASKWYTLAAMKLRLAPGAVPLPMVLAAQSWASPRSLAVDARHALFGYDGAEFFLLSTPAPSGRAEGLTAAELHVAQLIIDGVSRQDIATTRSTSAQTVACQLRSIHVKLKLSGRYELIRHAEKIGWFR